MNNNAERKKETYGCNYDNEVKKSIPKITGIMPAYNLFKAHYPFLECIISAMPLVDEFVFQDGGSTDGTLEAVKKFAKFYPIRIIKIPHYKGDNWESMDRALELAFSQIENGWVIEIQADEYYLQKDYQKILEEIRVANERGCNGTKKN